MKAKHPCLRENEVAILRKAERSMVRAKEEYNGADGHIRIEQISCQGQMV